MKRWRYLARRLNGDGTESYLHNDLPLSDVDLDRELSGPGAFSAVLKPEFYGLTGPNGAPLFVPWSTAIYCELDGVIRRGFLLTDVTDNGNSLSLPGVGFTGYAQGQPFHDEYSGIQVDPLDVVRRLWNHLQGKPAGNLGLVLDGTKSTVRIGKPEQKSNTGEEGPYVLGWWVTKDIGREIDELATTTPFDYVEEHAWVGDTENISHRLRIGAPTIGSRRQDLRFVVGENILERPKIEYSGDDYATGIIMLGAGEGRKTVRGTSVEPGAPGRLRRVLTLEDKSLTTAAAAARAADRERRIRTGDPSFKQFEVRDTPNTPLFSYDVGDEIQVLSKGGWNDGLDLWVRIIGVATDPQNMTDTISCIRSERA